MPAIQPLCCFFGINLNCLSKIEKILVESELFYQFCEEIKFFLNSPNHHFYYSIKLNALKEDTMLDAKLIRFILKDILATEEYSVKGIALYTDSFEDVINEIIIGFNSNPSGIFLQKLIRLHRDARPEVYQFMIKKIAVRFLIATLLPNTRIEAKNAKEISKMLIEEIKNYFVN